MMFNAELKSLVFTAMRKAGEAVRAFEPGDVEVQVKEDQSPVTEADLASNRILIEALQQTGKTIFSEEQEAGEPLNSAWIIDPLDGTKEFLRGTGEYSVMVAYVEEGVLLFGAVYQPSTGTLCYAVKGEGAFQVQEGGEKPLSVSSNSGARMIVSRSHLTEDVELIAKEFGVSEFVRCGSIGVKSMNLIMGQADMMLYTQHKLPDWDRAASHILLEEAGCSVSDIHGDAFVYLDGTKQQQGFVAAEHLSHARLVEIAKKYV